MGVICFSSLKGGVGKTSLSINVAAALAQRGGETLLIDLDPAAHTSRFFSKSRILEEAPLPRLFLNPDIRTSKSILELALAKKINLLKGVRERLVLLPGGAELRHFFWGKGTQSVKDNFAKLISELNMSFDYIVIDTAPDLNILVRNAIASADIAVAPVDGSVMSIDCLNQLMNDVSHIQGPQWAIVRSMFSKKASTLRSMSDQCIRESLDIQDLDFEETGIDADRLSSETQSSEPIYLLDSIIHRTEEQNKLTYKSQTAFENKVTKKLALEYENLSRELDALLMVVEDKKDLSSQKDNINGFDLTKVIGSSDSMESSYGGSGR